MPITTQDRTGKGLFKRSLTGAARDAECARMRAAGYLLREIAEHVGLKTEGAVAKAIERALRDVQAPAVEALRASQQHTLDLLKSTALDIMARDHVAHSNGRIVHGGCPGLDAAGNFQHDGCTFNVPGTAYCEGPPVIDDGPKLSAIAQLQRLLEREARLHGTDSPIRTAIEGDELVIRIKGGVDMDAV
jgi:hypothetical protein